MKMADKRHAEVVREVGHRLMKERQNVSGLRKECSAVKKMLENYASEQAVWLEQFQVEIAKVKAILLPSYHHYFFEIEHFKQ